MQWGGLHRSEAADQQVANQVLGTEIGLTRRMLAQNCGNQTQGSWQDFGEGSKTLEMQGTEVSQTVRGTANGKSAARGGEPWRCGESKCMYGRRDAGKWLVSNLAQGMCGIQGGNLRAWGGEKPWGCRDWQSDSGSSRS